jgi:hypothetical protein
LCEIYDTSHHIKCEGVTEDTYKYLQRAQGIHWYCKGCDKGVAKALTAIAIMQKKQDKFEKEVHVVTGTVDKLKIDMQELSQKMQDKLDQTANELKKISSLEVRDWMKNQDYS